MWTVLPWLSVTVKPPTPRGLYAVTSVSGIECPVQLGSEDECKVPCEGDGYVLRSIHVTDDVYECSTRMRGQTQRTWADHAGNPRSSRENTCSRSAARSSADMG